MPYTFSPEQKHAKAYGSNLRISRKSAVLLCRAISRKPLTRAKRLLGDLRDGKRNLKGKYYTKTAGEMLLLLDSCEKNAESIELDAGRLMVHASAHQGAIMRRRRRKGAFGSRMKNTNVEIILIEKGKESKIKVVRSKEDLEKVVKEVATKVAKERKAAEEKKEPAGTTEKPTKEETKPAAEAAGKTGKEKPTEEEKTPR
ncbi:MAG: hypothetical protein HYY37_06120 [Candidatus Aenigmarchaeota archaeon]|nr:hypothetical protein [Candidatus Aenigmarchaeota archaeon]